MPNRLAHRERLAYGLSDTHDSRVPDGYDTLRLVLASGSPRRAQLLRQAGFDFIVQLPELDERKYVNGTLPAELAVLLAREKAAHISRQFPEQVVLAADTVVAFGDVVVGKPRDADDAARILRLLRNATHIVVTGVAVKHVGGGFDRAVRVMSAVRMHGLTDAEIRRHIESGNWQGKAGAYGIQDEPPIVERLSGCHTNVIGLPMPTTTRLLGDAGIVPSIAARPDAAA
ncbi:MAG: Maf family protein [Tepidisphaeraceae bacterium]